MRQQSRHLPAFILLFLGENPMHGGAVQTALQARLPALKADSGAVYRALQQLERDECVVAEWDTSTPGPAKKIYRLTAAGWEKLDFWLEDIEQRMENLRYFVEAYRQLRRK